MAEAAVKFLMLALGLALLVFGESPVAWVMAVVLLYVGNRM